MEPNFQNPPTPQAPNPQMYDGEHHKHRKQTFTIVGLALLSILLLATSIWGFTSYHSLRANVDQTVEQKLSVELTKQEEALRSEFKKQTEATTKFYAGPDVYGSVKFAHPVSWSVYSKAPEASEVHSVVLHPEVVNSNTLSYALRMQITDTPYSQMIAGLQGKISKGDVKSTVYKKAGTVGVRLEGAITADPNDNGYGIMLPLRDKTLVLWTESKDYASTFEQAIKSLTFNP